MVLIKIVIDNLYDVSRILEFAQKNRKILEELTVLPGRYRTEEIEISKYQDFFKHVEYVATLKLNGEKNTADEARKLNEELLAMIKYTTMKRENTDNPLLYCLYDDIANQRDHLVQIVCFLRSKIIHSSENEGRATFSCLSCPKHVHTDSLDTGSGHSGETLEKVTALQNVGLNNVPNPKNDQYPKVQKRFTSELFNADVSSREVTENPGTVDDLHFSASDDGNTYCEHKPGRGHELNSSKKSAADINTDTTLTRGFNDVTAKSAEKPTTEDTKTKIKEKEKMEIRRKLEQLVSTDKLLNQENIDTTRIGSVRKKLDPSDARYGDLPEAQTGNEYTASGPMIKYAIRGTRKTGVNGNYDLRTLEDSLKVFDLFHRLSDLDESLEKVRRRKKTPEEHEADCKRFDKELQLLSHHHHPDSVMNRGGTEEEVARAKLLQSALNATRTVLNTINKMFLEDIDIDHKYAFFAKLDIGVLGNEDEVENHVYDVLFKISLVSDIKQENIVAEIRKFLEASQLCVNSFCENDILNFENHRGSAFYHLERCATGYEKLHGELQEVETECEKENLHHIYPVLKRMRCDCRKQMHHLKALYELSKLPGKLHTMYRRPMDEYFVLPLARYVNVILACSIMIKEPAGKKASNSWCFSKKVESVPSEKSQISNFGIDIDARDISFLTQMEYKLCGTSGKEPAGKKASNSSSFWNWFPKRLFCNKVELSAPEISQISNFGKDIDADISLLHQMASVYAGNKLCGTSGKEPFGLEHMDKNAIKMKFRETLLVVRDYLESRFQIKDYMENGTKKQIVKELKLCREMMAEFEKKTREVASSIEEIGKSNDRLNTGLDEILRDQAEIRNELNEFLANTEAIKKKIENFSRK